MDTTYFDEMIQHLVKNHTFLNPTLDFEWKGIIDRTPKFELEDQKLFFNPALQYVPEDERLVTLGQYHWAESRSASEREEFLAGYKKVQEFLRKFVTAGGKLYSGTDSASANTPGLALHHEMQLLVDAGIPPMQALLSSTKWPAEMARIDKNLGSVEVGKFGDLVILGADPLEDIHNTQTVEKVIKEGVVQDIGYHAGYDVPFHLTGPLTKHLYSQPPIVTNLEPALITQGNEVWVRVMGTNFSPNSVVLFEGKPVETKWVGDNELDGRLTAKETSHPGNYLIGVKTPKPGGGVTEGLGFIIDYR
jgi:Amidohydrolase family